MPELRQDPVTLYWVAIATERAKRPTAFTRSERVEARTAAQCPFCSGHETMTPPEFMAIRPDGAAPNTPGWELRVVPNLFPAFGPRGAAREPGRHGIYNTMTGTGLHEVIIHGPDHLRDLADFSVDKVGQLIDAYVERYRAAAADPAVEYVLIIVNHGREAGASLEHPHSQLLAIPLVPDYVRREMEGVARYQADTGECPFCAMAAYEGEAKERLVFENERFVVFEPYASRVPFESWIVPKRHEGRLERMTPDEKRDAAEALRAVAAALSRSLNDPPYNVYFHTAPVRGDDDYHWHIEVLPKLTIAAGFELGTGIMINVVTPESAAEALRAGLGA